MVFNAYKGPITRDINYEVVMNLKMYDGTVNHGRLAEVLKSFLILVNDCE